MKNKKVLIVGCGDIGTPLGLALVSAGATVWGLRRNPSNLPSAITAIKGDVTKLETLNCVKNIGFDYIVIALTPTSFSDEAYRNIYVHGFGNILSLLVQEQFTGHLFFISSTSVYHQHDGQWVDEDSPTYPTNFSGCRLLEAEHLLNKYSIASTIVRFAGIYGPGRRRLIEQVLSLKGCPEQPPIYTNRIHRDDCVGLLLHLITHHYKEKVLEKCYIGVDNMPATLWSVTRWLATQLGVDVNKLVCSKQNLRNSKRCSNLRMLASGYQLLYPNYQSGYKELIKNGL